MREHAVGRAAQNTTNEHRSPMNAIDRSANPYAGESIASDVSARAVLRVADSRKEFLITITNLHVSTPRVPAVRWNLACFRHGIRGGAQCKVQ